MTCADCHRPVSAGYCENCGAWSLDLGFDSPDVATADIPAPPTFGVPTAPPSTPSFAQAPPRYPRMHRAEAEQPTVPPSLLNAPPPRPGSIPGSPVPGTPDPAFSTAPPSAAPQFAAPPRSAPQFAAPPRSAPRFAAPQPMAAPPFNAPPPTAAPQFGAPTAAAPPMQAPQFGPPPAAAPHFAAPQTAAPQFTAAPPMAAPQFAPPTAPPQFAEAPAPTFTPPPTFSAPVPPERSNFVPAHAAPAPSEVSPTEPPELFVDGELPTVGVSLLWGPPRAADRVEVPAPAVDAAVDDDDWEATRMVRREQRTRTWALSLQDDSVEVVVSNLVIGRAASPSPEWPGAALVSVADPSRSVSKNHAIFSDIAGMLTVEDLYSTNGVVVTRADGIEFTLRPGGKAELDEGSTVELGEYLVRVHKLAAPQIGR